MGEKVRNGFPANSVLSSYISTENMLSDILRIVPYTKEHESVWSPAFSTIILESCSLIESLWKYEAKTSPYVKKERLTIVDYFTYFGEYLAPKWVVFWGEEPEKIQPFDAWLKTSGFKERDYLELDWWEAYNKLKHDRLRNRTKATLRHAVRSLSVLFLAILRCEFCRNAIAQANWLYGEGQNLQAHLGEDSPSTKLEYITVESKLFTYAVGWSEEPILKNMEWRGPCSHRFREWFDQYSTE